MQIKKGLKVLWGRGSLVARVWELKKEEGRFDLIPQIMTPRRKGKP